MLRLSPTIISLSKKDVKEHLKNIGRKAGAVQCDGVLMASNARSPLQSYIDDEVTGIEGSRGTSWTVRSNQRARIIRAREAFGRQPEGVDNSFASRASNSNDGYETSRMIVSNLRSSSLLLQPENRSVYVEDSEGSGNEHRYVVSPSDDADDRLGYTQQLLFQDTESRQRLTPPEHVFDYGGFVQSPSRDSSSFVPEDVSTPQETRLPNLQRLRARNPLPRSPLFRSYNPQHSPGRIISVGLTPRLASPGTPGVLFSHPARRPRNYRPRISSYSFEEFERASAAYEDMTASESNPQVGQSLPIEGDSLGKHRATSFQSSNGEVSLPSSPPGYIIGASVVPSTSGQMVSECSKTSLLSSPSLQLPPPFSTVSRNGSTTSSLPTGILGDARSSPRTPPRGDADGHGTPSSELAALDNVAVGQGFNRSPSSTGTARSIVSLPFRLIAAYRSRSPIGSWSLSPRTSTVPRRGSRDRRSTFPAPPPAPPNTPHRRLRVYDDRAPASLQPQTPQHLPEARHQSHYRPSYTAPVGQSYASFRQLRAGTRRGRGTRSDSSIGLDTPGFSGLYGGQENTDDEVMFGRAAQRLFLRRNTPEREMSFREA